MARKSISVRNAEQRERQAALRKRNREKRRPTRDDVARALLWKAIVDLHEKADRTLWGDLETAIVDILVEQGFDGRESELVIDSLVDRYTSGRGGFRRKVHLNTNHPDE